VTCKNKNPKNSKGGFPPPFIVVIVDFNEAKKIKKHTRGCNLRKKKEKKMFKAYFANLIFFT
jgi:hypothetical protein